MSVLVLKIHFGIEHVLNVTTFPNRIASIARNVLLSCFVYSSLKTKLTGYITKALMVTSALHKKHKA